MARITTMPDFMLTPVWIWDLNQQVGWGLTNRRDDVMLVQTALNRVMKQLQLGDSRKTPASGPLGPVYPDLGYLTPDGIFGNETYNAIGTYQRLVGPSDGVVDPIYKMFINLGGDPIGAQLMAYTKANQRTMYRLNKHHLQIYGRMMSEDDFPPELRGAVARSNS